MNRLGWWVRPGCAVQLGVAGLCFSAAAGATPPGQPFRLEYWARGRCPDAADFAREIQTRAPRLRPAEGDEPALGFYAELDEGLGSATGRLTARTPDGREVVREVRGTTCDDVVTALALIAALAADPTQPVEVPPPTRVPSHARVHREERLPADTDEPDLPTPPEALTPDPQQHWTFGVGGGLGFDSSIAPSPGFGLSVAFDGEAGAGSVWRPLFSLSANLAAAAATPTRAGYAAFTWLAFRLAGCPMRWPEQTPLFFRPCLFADAGLLEGRVKLDEQNSDRTPSWFAWGAFGRVEALVGESVSFQLDGGVTAPLKHDEFKAGSTSESAFQVPSAGAMGRIGLSYRFK